MTNLIVHDDLSRLEKTSFGGGPVKNREHAFEWPICGSCHKPMQFLGKIDTDRGMKQIFMCQNDPGMCDDWDATSGGNAVVVIQPQNLEHVEAPTEGVTDRGVEYGANVIVYSDFDYEEAASKWTEENEQSRRMVLGQLYGTPIWIQHDETPACDECSNPMRFVAQLEQGPDWKTEMNFGGGGSGYLFDCSCNSSAKFLWQS